MSSVSYSLRNDAPHREYSADKDGRNMSKLPYVEKVQEKIRLRCVSNNEKEVVFDMIGVDVSIVNALRRIMLAEVPTMAIETVYIEMNTSVVFDEVLSHRLGLIPIDADPRMFEEVQRARASTENISEETEDRDGEDRCDEYNTLVFSLNVQCTKPSKNDTSQDGKPYTQNVLSGDLVWVPQGNQAERFPGGIKPLYPDILIAKLRSGQEISLEAHCRKGIGKDHTKFSPVATASYRLMPKISFLNPLKKEMKNQLVELCPMNVFEIEEIKSKSAIRVKPRNCSMCRECIRHPGWSDYIKLERVADHFIFSIESESALQPVEILKESIRVLKEKCVKLIPIIEQSASNW